MKLDFWEKKQKKKLAWFSGSSIVSSPSVHRTVVINKAELSRGLDGE